MENKQERMTTGKPAMEDSSNELIVASMPPNKIPAALDAATRRSMDDTTSSIQSFTSSAKLYAKYA